MGENEGGNEEEEKGREGKVIRQDNCSVTTSKKQLTSFVLPSVFFPQSLCCQMKKKKSRGKKKKEKKEEREREKVEKKKRKKIENQLSFETLKPGLCVKLSTTTTKKKKRGQRTKTGGENALREREKRKGKNEEKT